MSEFKFIFNVSINGEKSKEFISDVPLYHLVALKASKFLPYENKNSGEVIVRVWQDSLLSKFGALTYQIKEDKAILLK